MPYFSEKLELFALGDVGLDDSLEAFPKLLVILLDESFGVVVGMAIEEGAIDVGYIAVGMRPDDFDQL